MGKLTKTQKKILKDFVLVESMEYTLLDWNESETLKNLGVDDKEFLTLREKYIAAANSIADLLEIDNEDWQRGKI